MLRKRNRSVEKEQHMGHLKMSIAGFETSTLSSDNHKNNSFFSVPGLFVGLSPKGLSDSDSVRSPTSPLDFRVFSNLGSTLRSPKSPCNGQQKCWDTIKVGLSIIDSLKDNDDKFSGKVLRSESKNILFGPQMRTKTPNSHETNINIYSFVEAPKSLPKNYAIFPYTQIKSPLHKGNSDVVFEIGETPIAPPELQFGRIRSCSLDSCRSISASAGFTPRSSNLSYESSGLENLVGGIPNSNNFAHIKPNSMSEPVGSDTGFTESLSASEIELSEEYTRVISHGPNPKTTHIYGDCVLDCCTNYLSYFDKNGVKELEGGVTSSNTPYPSDDFLSFCHSCNKKLEGKDIYIYRGEKAFCSLDCRSEQILIDEKLEKTKTKSCENSFPTDEDDEDEDDEDEEFSEASIVCTT
ncbi:hypothetical protein LWI29_005322 [Acer saccharum]|uniref:FLZ-type domain-containing protein n=1 Tax=Acer saccharum TaxID=4024 RepID=A0AA39RC53_ACESA|nr:hypothetical protein LWI29_005322 [Acer saccharum]